jgi:plasmid stability protein
MKHEVSHMGQITLRDMPPVMEREIRIRAKRTGQSLNKVVQEIVGESLGLGARRAKPAGASLARLAGGWTEGEAKRFNDAVRVFEEIDEEMWK